MCYRSERSEPKFEESIAERTKLKKQKNIYTVGEFSKLIIEKEKSINMELFQKRLKFSSLSLILRILYNVEDKEKKNNELVGLLKSGLNDLKDETEQMSEDEKRIEQPDKSGRYCLGDS